MKNKNQILRKATSIIFTMIICLVLTSVNETIAQGWCLTTGANNETIANKKATTNRGPAYGKIPQGQLMGSKKTVVITDFGGNTTGQYTVDLNFFTNCYNTTAKMKAVVDLNLDTKSIKVLEYSHFDSKNTNDPVVGSKIIKYPKSEKFSKYKIFLVKNKLYLEQVENPCGPNGKIRMNASSWRMLTSKAPERTVTPVNDGVYVIKSKAAGLQNVDVFGGKTANGTNISLYGSNSRDGFFNQRFLFVEAGGGYYRIETTMKAGMAIDIYYAKTADQSNANLWEKNGNNAQKFKLIDAGNGYVKIVSALGPNLYLGVSDDNKNLVLRRGNKGDKILFKIDRVSHLVKKTKPAPAPVSNVDNEVADWVTTAATDVGSWTVKAANDIVKSYDVLFNGRQRTPPRRGTTPKNIPDGVRHYVVTLFHVSCWDDGGDNEFFGDDIELYGSVSAIVKQGKMYTNPGANQYLFHKREGDRVVLSKSDNPHYSRTERKDFYIPESEAANAKIDIVSRLMEHDDFDNDRVFATSTRGLGNMQVGYYKEFEFFAYGENEREKVRFLYAVSRLK